jgi:hypothetical protein
LIFSYYGSKSKIWKKYPAPIYNTIIEPFSGAANYSLRHSNGRHIILIEKNPVIVSMLKWLQNLDLDFIRNLPHPKAQEPIPDIEPKEARDFLGFMLNQGSPTPKNFVGSFKGNQNLNWNKVAEDVAKICTWEILLGDYFIAPDIEATWFIDPPYIGQKLYPYGKDLDYEVLASWCKSRKGQVIVCENDTAVWLPFKPLCTVSGQRKNLNFGTREFGQIYLVTIFVTSNTGSRNKT